LGSVTVRCTVSLSVYLFRPCTDGFLPTLPRCFCLSPPLFPLNSAKTSPPPSSPSSASPAKPATASHSTSSRTSKVKFRSSRRSRRLSRRAFRTGTTKRFDSRGTGKREQQSSTSGEETKSKQSFLLFIFRRFCFLRSSRSRCPTEKVAGRRWGLEIQTR
jgi:hypothetical protein